MHPILYIVVFLLCGCRVHRGYSYPGPTSHMGREPLSYLQRVADQLPSSSEEEPSTPERETPKGELVVASAVSLLGQKKLMVGGQSYRYDCSGFVMAAYAGAEIVLSGSSRGLYELSEKEGWLHKKKIPKKGDVAFFDNSFDRNKNGRRDDELTHVALVESVDEDGTITMIHLGGQGIVRTVMNLKHPELRQSEDGKVLNSWLRVATKRDKGPRLTGQLWKAFASMWQKDSD